MNKADLHYAPETLAVRKAVRERLEKLRAEAVGQLKQVGWLKYKKRWELRGYIRGLDAAIYDCLTWEENQREILEAWGGGLTKEIRVTDPLLALAEEGQE